MCLLWKGEVRGLGKYKVITDRKFFTEFGWMGNRIKNLGGFFQNEGLTATKDEVEEWEKKIEFEISKLIELKNEGLARIEKISN